MEHSPGRFNTSRPELVNSGGDVWIGTRLQEYIQMLPFELTPQGFISQREIELQQRVETSFKEIVSRQSVRRMEFDSEQLKDKPKLRLDFSQTFNLVKKKDFEVFAKICRSQFAFCKLYFAKSFENQSLRLQ